MTGKLIDCDAQRAPVHPGHGEGAEPGGAGGSDQRTRPGEQAGEQAQPGEQQAGQQDGGAAGGEAGPAPAEPRDGAAPAQSPPPPGGDESDLQSRGTPEGQLCWGDL